MPNRSILGGSPLGLIGVRSFYDNKGISTFNAGKTRNIKVTEYNKNSSSAGMLYGNSLFSGYRVFRAWPSISMRDGEYDTKGTSDVDYYNKKDISARRELHNDSIYDTSVLNIIEQLANTKAQLRPADFAYLKNVGVYPNNRLMIARRFVSPSDDNIMVPKGKSEIGSIATLISWIPEGENFLDITFGEEWTDAEGSFKEILNGIGDDIGLGKMGDLAGGAGGILPLPGFTEIFQRQFLAKMGIIDSDSANMIPAGNPNLIKQAKRRKLIGYEEAGSSLKTTVSIKMTCEYELKYISGIDPTLVWMDILGMVTRFGTSNSETYGLSKKFGVKARTWLNKPEILIRDITKALSEAVKGLAEEAKTELDKIVAEKEEEMELEGDDDEGSKVPFSDDDEEMSEEEEFEKEKDKAYAMIEKLVEKVQKGLEDVLNGLVRKYRVKILGVINALTGLPSTPWHITIGNPLRPTFCSGDMLVDSVSLKLGPILAFNDLPSSITVEFNLVNARAWGLQEIMSKFNSGYLRTVDAQKTLYETAQVRKGDKMYVESAGILPLNSDLSTAIESNSAANSSGSSGTSGASSTSGLASNASDNNVNPNSGTSGVTGTSGAQSTSGVTGVSPNIADGSPTGQESNKTEITKDAGAV